MDVASVMVNTGFDGRHLRLKLEYARSAAISRNVLVLGAKQRLKVLRIAGKSVSGSKGRLLKCTNSFRIVL